MKVEFVTSTAVPLGTVPRGQLVYMQGDFYLTGPVVGGSRWVYRMSDGQAIFPTYKTLVTTFPSAKVVIE